jgi:bifunctional NMN adenylyltransferase/nudix hydrolase
MANLRIGVIIGRFQVPSLHNGHMRLYREVRDRSDGVVFLLGVSPVDTLSAEHPLSFTQRSYMIRACIDDPHVNIMPLHNKRTDEEWSSQIDALLLATYPDDDVTLYGGRDSFTSSYRGKLDVQHLAMVPPIVDAGTVLRQAVKPKEHTAFLEGQIYAMSRQYPRVFPTVDVAVLREDEVLLIQRADSGQWSFPGGFVDPTDGSMAFAAAREIQEELGLAFPSGADSFDYVGSFRINDWRYRGTRDRIMTTFFTVPFFSGPVVPNYAEVEDFKWMQVMKAEVSDIHQPLLDALRKR